MQIKVKRFDKTLPFPAKKTSGAACFDLYSRETVTISPGQISYIPLNIALEIPKDTFLLMTSRSSTHKLGILMANGICIGDSDFCGDSDEYAYPALNFTNNPVTIEKGTRIAQMVVISIVPQELVEVESLHSANRGKFGSTGFK